jgi:ketosteroid isomerase-like protein
LRPASTRSKVFTLFAFIALGIAAFVLGFVSCLNLKHAAPADESLRLLGSAGDAPPEVRDGVRAALRAFNDAYAKRDVAQLDAFMARTFPGDADIVLIGSEGTPTEWARGHHAIRGFIQHDWQTWGTFRFDADKALVWSSGDIAWVATFGAVQYRGAQRPLRLTAILERHGDAWLFRQLHFQWDDCDPGARDLLRPRTYLTLARLAFARLAHRPLVPGE